MNCYVICLSIHFQYKGIPDVWHLPLSILISKRAMAVYHIHKQGLPYQKCIKLILRGHCPGTLDSQEPPPPRLGGALGPGTGQGVRRENNKIDNDRYIGLVKNEKTALFLILKSVKLHLRTFRTATESSSSEKHSQLRNHSFSLKFYLYDYLSCLQCYPLLP